MDEVEPCPVGFLHPQDELENTSSPSLDPAELGVRPDLGQNDEQARGVVDARDAFEAGLLGVDDAVGVLVDRDREGVRTGGGDRPREAPELSQHRVRQA